MKATNAAVLLLIVCLVLAVMLLRGVISPAVAGTVFAMALAGFGLAREAPEAGPLGCRASGKISRRVVRKAQRPG